ncbi:MAG: metallophosphoesterase [Bryobacterales bacterium]|nr:metallophosphoesterase [Bryobacterales bacterium]
MSNRTLLFFCAVCLLVGQQQRRARPGNEVFRTDVPAHRYDLTLARPTANSVTATVLAYEPLEAFVEYDGRRSESLSLSSGEPASFALAGLRANQPYTYRLRFRSRPAGAWETSPAYSFHTQRAPGSAFTFVVQADSHLDAPVSPQGYEKALAWMRAANPDFLIDLGDTFMVDKRRTDFRQALPQYLAQRYYFGLLCHSVPLFLALGNHDGEGGARHDGTRNSMAAWSLALRKRYFPNPRPDAFYSGNETPDSLLGPLENYYAWQWGDALFVVLDPYWATVGRGRGGNWHWTLGDAQYRWLARTLSATKAAHRFVFLHHPTGAKGQPVRGGVAAALYNEWGGRNEDGSDAFRARRPGWEMPVHALLAKHKVAAVFHGHDHMYAREELDGVVYQLVPQPGNVRAGIPRNAGEYGYTSGTVLGGAGHVRVRLDGQRALVEYVLTDTGKVAHSYTIGRR